MTDSSSNNKRIAKNTLFLYLRMFLVMAVSLFTVRVLLRTLGVEDYGVYNAVGGVVVSLNFISSVLAAASQRFFSFYLGKDDEKQLKKSFSMVFLTYLIVVGLFVFVAETAGLWFVFNKMTFPAGSETSVMWVYQMAVATFTCTLLSNPFQALIISHEDMNVYASVSIVEVLLKLAIVYLLGVLSFDKLSLYAILHFLVFLGIGSTYVFISRSRYKESHFTLVWDKPMFKEIFSYSSWSLFGSLAGMCNTQGVNIILNVFHGPIANAAYSISAQVSAAVQQFGTSFYTAVRPSLIKSYAGNQFDYMNKLFLFSSKVLFFLMFIIILPVFISVHDLLQIWLGNVEEYMVEFTRLSMIYTLLLCLSNPITTIIQAANEVKRYHLMVDTFTLLSLPLIYVLFKMGVSPVYAYIVIISVFSVAHCLRLQILHRTTGFPISSYLLGFLVPVALTVIISSIIAKYSMCLTLNNLLVSTFANCAIGVIVALLVGAFFVFSKSERALAIDFIRNKMKK